MMPRAAGGKLGGSAGVHQFAETEPHARLDPGGGAFAHLFTGRSVEQIRGERFDLGRQDVTARQQPRHRSAATANAQL